MRRLRDGDEIDAVLRQAAGFGGGYPEFDRGMGRGVADLLGRSVGGGDPPEMRCQPQRGLAAAGGAIPRDIVFRASAGKPGKSGAG